MSFVLHDAKRLFELIEKLYYEACAAMKIYT